MKQLKLVSSNNPECLQFGVDLGDALDERGYNARKYIPNMFKALELFQQGQTAEEVANIIVEQNLWIDAI
jgi:hypothetical protein